MDQKINTLTEPEQESVQNFHSHGTGLQQSVAGKEVIGYEGIENIDRDVDLAFRLRGISLNPLIDAASPLISMTLDIKKLHEIPNIDQLYHRVRDEIFAIVEEIKTLGYDNTVQLSFRYCLCSFIDEAVMGTPWGGKSMWAQQSMLAYFHNETWGGEKFFMILSRTMSEPDKYQDILEFIYLCLSLGFKGQYSVEYNGAERVQETLAKLNHVLREQRGDPPENLLKSIDVKHSNFKVEKRFPLWGVWMIALIILSLIFIGYNYNLNSYSDQVLTNIERILEKWSIR